MPYRADQIDPSKTAMIVVDMQNDFVAEGAALRSAQAAAMVPELAATLKFCREKKIGFLFLTATTMGAPLYRKFGFHQCGEEALELWWDEFEKVDLDQL